MLLFHPDSSDMFILSRYLEVPAFFPYCNLCFSKKTPLLLAESELTPEILTELVIILTGIYGLFRQDGELGEFL